MKKLLFICLLLPVLTFAQTDSTDIKLQHYKDLFIKGLISAQEYETLKQQTLGIKPAPQPQTIIINNPKPKPEIDEKQAEKMRLASTPNIVCGVLGIGAGVGLISGGVVYYKNNYFKAAGSSVDGSYPVREVRRVRIITAALCGFGSLSTILGITGLSVGITQKQKLKRYDAAVSINITPSTIGFACKF